LSSKVKSLERQLDHTIQLKNAIEEENRGLHSSMEQLKKEWKELEKRNQDFEGQKSRIASERIALKQKSRLFDEKMQNLQENLELRKQTMSNLEEELASAKNQIELLTEERDALRREAEHYKEIDEENIRLRRDIYLLSDEIQDWKKDVGQLESKISQLYEENYELKANYESLKSKLSFLRDIDWNIRPDIFNTQQQHHQRDAMDPNISIHSATKMNSPSI
jgi:chromosome segregation ATPase